MPCRTVAIMNQKGGVGKTTTALNLGAALAEAGRRTLLVDLDPQANLTRGLGVEVAALGQSTYDALTNPKADINTIVQATRWDLLDIAPSHIDLSGAEIEMVSMYGRELRLAQSLRNVKGIYHYILIDCLPSLSLLTINAMTAADEIVVPMQAHPFALEGLGKLFEVFELIRAQMNPRLRLGGVLVTMFDTRTNVSKEVVERLAGDPRTSRALFKTIVRQNIKIAESQGAGVPVIHFDPECHGAIAYRELAREVIAQEAQLALEEPPLPEVIPVEEAELAEAGLPAPAAVAGGSQAGSDAGAASADPDRRPGENCATKAPSSRAGVQGPETQTKAAGSRRSSSRAAGTSARAPASGKDPAEGRAGEHLSQRNLAAA